MWIVNTAVTNLNCENKNETEKLKTSKESLKHELLRSWPQLKLNM